MRKEINMKKKTAAMVLAALMAFSMTACGNGSTQKEDDSTAADQETTETTETAENTAAEDTTSGDEAVELHWLNKCESDVEAQIWQQVADLVHEKYPNITVTVENTDWTSYWTKLPVELASGNAPDLIYMHFSRASDYTNSMLPISDYIEKDEDINIDDFYSGILDSFIFDDQVYALPYDFGPYIMYYNKDLFDKYGVEYPDENTTWEEFKDKCKQLTQDGNYGTVFASSLDYYDPQVLSLGGEIINEKGEFDITGDKTTAALQSLADLINVDKVAPKIADTANTVWNWEQFEGGNIGMLIDGPWTVTNVVNYCDFNVGYSIIPTGVTNRMIKENLKKLSQEADIWIRIPMVHHVNDTEEELNEMIEFISSLGDGVKKIQLLKYHSLGKMKYQWIGKECVEFEEPDELYREHILSKMRELPFYVEWN